MFDLSIMTRGFPGQIDSEVSRTATGWKISLKGMRHKQMLWDTVRKINEASSAMNCISTFVAHEMRRQSIGTCIMENSIRFSSSLRLQRITLRSVGWGRYMWARDGFLPDVNTWRGQLRDSLKECLVQYARQISLEQSRCLNELINESDPKAIVYIARLKQLVVYKGEQDDIDDEIPLGCALLMSTPTWEGTRFLY